MGKRYLKRRLHIHVFKGFDIGNLFDISKKIINYKYI